MSHWFKKSVVVLISILTFGLVTPTHAFFNENNQLDKSQSKESSIHKEDTKELSPIVEQRISHEDFVQNMINEAEKNAYVKFGDKIKTVIEDEFQKVILPNIQAAIAQTALAFPEDDLSSLTISEVPKYAKSEKIFHIVDSRTQKDILRFHVRRDHPPLEGFYFNFHYHTYHDDFQTHHDLGSIYWDKNTPPQWMSAS